MFPIAAMLGSGDVVINSNLRCFTRVNSSDVKLALTHKHFGFLMSVSQQGKTKGGGTDE